MVGSRFMNYTQCIILSQNLSSMLGGFLIYIFREFLQHCGKIFLIYFDGLLQYDFLFDGEWCLLCREYRLRKAVTM